MLQLSLGVQAGTGCIQVKETAQEDQSLGPKSPPGASMHNMHGPWLETTKTRVGVLASVEPKPSSQGGLRTPRVWSQAWLCKQLHQVQSINLCIPKPWRQARPTSPGGFRLNNPDKSPLAHLAMISMKRQDQMSSPQEDSPARPLSCFGGEEGDVCVCAMNVCVFKHTHTHLLIFPKVMNGKISQNFI